MASLRPRAVPGTGTTVRRGSNANNRDELIKFDPRLRLIRPNVSCSNDSLKVILSPNRGTGHAPEHRELTDVTQGVGDRPLEQSFGLALKRLFRCEPFIEARDLIEKTPVFRIPGSGRTLLPDLAAVGHMDGPGKEIGYVSHYLQR